MTSVNIYLVGSRGTKKLTEFEQFATQQDNAGLKLAVVDGPVLPNLFQYTSGVVVFDDGQQSTTEWIAKVREQTRYLSVPLIAVASRNEKEIHARLAAAGASAVCDCESSNESILAEIRSHFNVEPVLQEIAGKLLGPFTTATGMTLREMAQLDATVRSVYRKTNYKMFGDISAVIGLIAATEGAMVLSFPDATAVAIVKRVLGGIEDQPDTDIIRDCIGELANVIAGQAKGILANTSYEFGMSTPTVVAGAGHEIRHKPGMPCLVIAFGSELGDFALQICLGA
jgi:chemotaxis protein CheX